MNLSTGRRVRVSYAMSRMKIRDIKRLLQTEYLRFVSDLPQSSGGMLKRSLIQLKMPQRGMTVESISESNRWSKGLCFLWQDEENWPKRPATLDDKGEEESRTSVESKATFTSLGRPYTPDISKAFERFSSWFQLKKCVTWILRYKDKLCNAVAKQKEGEAMQFDTEKKSSPLAVTELDFAERAIIRAVQDASFSEELLSLKTSQK